MTKRKESKKSLQSVCDVMGKKCKGNAEFYTRKGKSNMGVGLRIISVPADVATYAEGKEPPLKNLLQSEEYRELLDKISYSTIGDRLVIRTEEDVMIDEVDSNGIIYPVYKLAYGKHFVYTMKLGDESMKNNINSIVSAFVVALMAEMPEEEEDLDEI